MIFVHQEILNSLFLFFDKYFVINIEDKMKIINVIVAGNKDNI